MVFRRLFGKTLILAFVGCVLSGCATVNVPNYGAENLGTYDDEERLFRRSEETQKILAQSRFLYDDKAIDDFLDGIIRRLLPEGINSSDIKLSAKVIKDPSLNSIAFANGRIFVHSGILASAENESQVATVLAHEIAHVLCRHNLKELRALKNKTAFWDGFGLITLGAGMLVSEVAKTSSISGFSKELETEADEVGFDLLNKAGYDVTQAPVIFEKMDAYLKGEKINEPYFFSSYPKLLQRIENFKRLSEGAKRVGSKAVSNMDYQQLVHELIVENLNICLEKGLYMTIENQIPRLRKVYPDDERIPFIKGELYKERYDPPPKKKTRDKNEDYQIALEAYDEALKINDKMANALLGKGRVLHALGKKTEALEFYNKYLQEETSEDRRSQIEYLIKKANEQ